MTRIPRFQFSLRTATFVLASVAVVIGVWANRAHRQRRAVIALRDSGAIVKHSDEEELLYDEDRQIFIHDKPERVWVALQKSSWWRDFIYDVVYVKGSPEFSDIEMAMLGDIPSLRELDLHWTNVTSRGVAYVRRCPQLIRLDLSETAVDDSCLGYLVGLKNLRYLALSRTGITDQGLVKLWPKSTLRELVLTDSFVHEVAVDHLRIILPDCEITFSSRRTAPLKAITPGAPPDRHESLTPRLIDRTLTPNELELFFEESRAIIAKSAPHNVERDPNTYTSDRASRIRRLSENIHHRCLIPLFAAILRDEADEPEVRRAAAEGLKIADPVVVDVLIDALHQADGVGRVAEWVLCHLTTVAVGRTKHAPITELPTLEQRIRHQDEWRAWWHKNRARCILDSNTYVFDDFFTEEEWDARHPLAPNLTQEHSQSQK